MIFKKMCLNNKKINKGLVFITIVLSPLFLFSQTVLKGQILDQKSQPIASATIQVLEQQNNYVVSDFDGKFNFQNLELKKYIFQIKAIGYKSKNVVFQVTSSNNFLKIVLQQDITALDEVVINGKTKVDLIKEQAFEVEALEIKQLKNASVDINGILATIPGVNIRQNGGLGSDFNFSLNGFSGNQVKFFIDGIPQDNLGTALSFNNFPATLIDRVEVYKGVVPVFLGADALGGAINIISNQEQKNFLDVSYDIGSFNTHRATLNGHYYTDKGFAFQLSSFFNYSDNDYTINGNEFGKEGFAIRDELGNNTGLRRKTAKRFHDAYESQMIQARVGFINKKFADKILVGITAAANENEIQHSQDPEIPFGEMERNEEVFRASINFLKDSLLNGKLKVKAYGELASIKAINIDTSSRQYNWFGEFIIRNDKTRGERGGSKSILSLDDSRRLINTSSTYKLDKNNTSSINYTYNYLERSGNDPLNTFTTPFKTPHKINKHIIGASHTFNFFNQNLQLTAFGKSFFINTISVNEDVFNDDIDTRFSIVKNRYKDFGYGFASSYKITKGLQVKLSHENTIRVPEGYEFFGDGNNLIANPNLLPEESKNTNAGLLFNYSNRLIKVNLDTNFFRRDTDNLLFLSSRGNVAQYINLSKVLNTGFETEILIRIFNKLSVGGNITYQYIEDKNIDQRIPNIPYTFGNFSLAYTLKKLFQSSGILNINLNSFYVEEFPFQSFIDGSSEERLFIPRQFSHNLNVSYSLKDGRYNISFLISNLTNERLYDNFAIQKPGRAFFIKFRHNLF